MINAIRKIWSKFVTPWSICCVEREGYRNTFVFARKFFGKTQYVRYYNINEHGNHYVHRCTFLFTEADSFDMLNKSRHNMLLEINNPRKKPEIKLTKVDL